MQVVWHEANLPDVNHRIVMVYLRNLIAQNSLSKCRWIEVGRFATLLRASDNPAKDRSPACNYQRYLVCSWYRVVVPIHATCLTTFVHPFRFLPCARRKPYSNMASIIDRQRCGF